MKKLVAAAALVSLAACAGAGFAGPRADWQCDRGAAFSARSSAQRAEVFAGGRLYRLPAVQAEAGSRYSDGAVVYSQNGDQATLDGAFGGPYANCRRHT